MLGGAIIVGLIAICVIYWYQLQHTSIAARRRPNIILILADDMGYGDTGAYNKDTLLRTPHLDQMAQAGQQWMQFYVGAPVCSPSRGALLTGKLPPRTGLYGEKLNVMFPHDVHGGIPEEDITLAEVCREVGYETTMIGKWHLGDASWALPTRHGFDTWFGLPYSNDMDWSASHSFTFDELVEEVLYNHKETVEHIHRQHVDRLSHPQNEFWEVPLLYSTCEESRCMEQVVQEVVNQTTLMQVYTEHAVAYLKEQKHAEPFFLYFAHNAPHVPLFPGTNFANKSALGSYGDVMEELDWSVGQILSAVQGHADLVDNTVVIFLSDNGPWRMMEAHGGSSGVLKGGKGTVWEGGMRVPALFWGPPSLVLPGQVVDAIGSAIDLFPTFARWVQNDKYAVTQDGFDLSEVLSQGHTAKNPRNTIEYYERGVLHAYRKGPWKAHFHDGEELLFNLEEDVSEQSGKGEDS